MNKTLTAAILSTVIAAPAVAGGLAEPVMEMEPQEIMAAVAPSSSNGELIVPLILLALITLALSNSGSDAVAVPIITGGGDLG